MQFAICPLDDCLGGILAHSIYLSDGKIGKGTLITGEVLERMSGAGVTSLSVAKLEDGDLSEDEAAARLALTLAPANVQVSKATTGRINIYATARGILRVDRELMRAINMVDEGITLASVQHNQLLETGDMIATLKIIPFSVAETAIADVVALVGSRNAFTFHPVESLPVSLIQTGVPGMKETIFSATETVTKHRLNQLGCSLVDSQIVDHDRKAICQAISSAVAHGAKLLLICGASAIADRRDVVPTGILAAGGAIDHLGLPADPGNLLMMAHINDIPVIGMPGCARSPKLNGFDWVLHLVLAGFPLDDSEIADMAVGGLLTEIASRPLPRKMTERRETANKSVGAIVLAAGQSRRMGEQNKLLVNIDGMPMVRRCVVALQAGGINDVLVVTGHQSAEVEEALSGLEVRFIHNADFADGQAGSVACGIAAMDEAHSAALVALGDMPDISAELVAGLVADHIALPNSLSRISFPVYDGQRGNPVIWGYAFFDDLRALTGDSGGRQILGSNAAAINSFSWHDDSIHRDIDTRDALIDRLK